MGEAQRETDAELKAVAAARLALAEERAALEGEAAELVAFAGKLQVGQCCLQPVLLRYVHYRGVFRVVHPSFQPSIVVPLLQAQSEELAQSSSDLEVMRANLSHERGLAAAELACARVDAAEIQQQKLAMEAAKKVWEVHTQSLLLL